jgi:hypothetical protein
MYFNTGVMPVSWSGKEPGLVREEPPQRSEKVIQFCMCINDLGIRAQDGP